MVRPKHVPLLLATALALAGCSDAPAPTAALAPAAMAPTPAPAADRYLVDVLDPMAGFRDRVADLGGHVFFAHERTGIAVVEGLEPAAVERLVREGLARKAVADALLLLDPMGEPEPRREDAPAADPGAAPSYRFQWHHRAILADRAWAAGRLGSPSVRVAILDTGLDYTHPDLAGRVDLARSRSFVPSDDALAAMVFPGAHPVADLHYHGTHVGSTVASNARVAAGVTSRTTLIGVKVCGVLGSCPTSAVLAGLLWAADQGADVINLSVGGAVLRSGSDGFVGLLNQAVQHANRVGATVVVAAGNNASDLDRNRWSLSPGPGGAEQTHLPSLLATYCDVAATLCVAATGPTGRATPAGPWTDWDAPAPYTNFGRSAIGVAAPGGTAAGPVVAACSTFSLLVPVCRSGAFSLGLSGTSMAAPHVAGLAALLVEDHGRNPGRIRAVIQNSADDVGEPGVDPYSGKGRINVARALGIP
jgi:lantibiotic leader peptide-processing serine protease